jgi:flagellar hook-associated protein 2
MATTSITTSLGAGSGIDTKALVASLIEAQFETRTKQLTAKSEALTVQISDTAKLKSAMTDFNAALKALIDTGTLATQPSSSNSSVLSASAIAGASVKSLASTVEVKQLASAQVATGRELSRTAAFNTGTLNLQFGQETVAEDGSVSFDPLGTAASIEIGPGDATLDGIAAKINAAAKGVTASVVADGQGGRLVLRSGTGATQAFRLTGADRTTDAAGNPVPTTGIGLDQLNVSRDAGSPGVIGAGARDAVLVVDGATFQRASNSVRNLIDGVKLDLTAVGITRLGTTPPTAALGQAVSNFAATYNEVLALVKEADDPINGTLKSDPAVNALRQGLRALSTAALGTCANGGPRTLSDLGVATQRDGSLVVDPTRLNAVLLSNGDAVEAMFAAGGGLSTTLAKLSSDAASTAFGLGASATRYAKAKDELAKAQDKLSLQSEAASSRMTKQFAAMDARVAAYKSTMAFMEQQVDAWTKSND